MGRVWVGPPLFGPALLGRPAPDRAARVRDRSLSRFRVEPPRPLSGPYLGAPHLEVRVSAALVCIAVYALYGSCMGRVWVGLPLFGPALLGRPAPDRAARVLDRSLSRFCV